MLLVYLTRLMSLEPPEVFKDGKTSQNHPKHIEQNDCRKGLFRGCPNKGDAGDNRKDIKPPELLAEQETRKDDGNLCGKPPCFYSIYFCPIIPGGHSFNCRDYLLKKHG